MNSMILVLSIALLIVFWAVGAYGRLANLRSRVRHAFAEHHGHLKQRHALIARQVELAKTCMQGGNEALEAAAVALTQAEAHHAKPAVAPMDAALIQQLAAAESALLAASVKLLAMSRAHAALRDAPQMKSLTEELAAAESKLNFARQVYNDSVARYNVAIEQFPSSVVAGMTRFKKAWAF